MKKYLGYIFILILFVSCNENVATLDLVVQDRKIRLLVNEYIDNVLNKNVNNNIYVTATVGKNPNIIEIGLYNQRPIVYTDNDTEYLNTYIKSKQFGIFKYKGVNFFVTNDLKNIFKLNYKSFNEAQSMFEKKSMPEPNDFYTMFINMNKEDSSIFYYSNLSKESLKWKEMK